MKLKYLYLLLFFTVCFGNAQIINFTDANFKTRLLSATTSNGIAKNQAGASVVIDTNGDSQIQVSEALVIYQLTANGASITSMGGIEYFTNLRKFGSNGTSITSLNINTLTNLTDLSVTSSQLASLSISGLSNLVNLSCNDNKLTSINLSGLSSLVYFKCSNNLLTSLNINNMTSLVNLYCYENQLTSLDLSGMPLLDEVYSYSNQLTSLNLAGCSSLKRLYTYSNVLTALDVSSCPILFELQCYSNNLSTLNLSNHQQLAWVDCNTNLLTSINVQGCINMTELKADHNLLTTLDISDTKVGTLYVNNNQLTSLFVKNGTFETLFYIMNNPNLSYICCDESQLTSVQNAIVTFGIPFCTVNTYCSFTPGGNLYGTLRGNVRIDSDENGCDVNDYNYPSMKFKVVSGSTTANYYADNSGFYRIALPNGSYTVTPQFENSSYYTISPINFALTFPNVVNPQIQDFCVTPSGIHNDLEITILPIGRARPGFDASYKIIYKNKGNHIQDGSINLSFDDTTLDFVNATPAIQSTSVNNLNWSFSNLHPFETRVINLTFNLNSPVEIPPLSAGGTLHYTATIAGAVDETPNDNISTLNQIIVNSLDPNDKTCIEGTTITPSMVGEYVHYVIRFENSGTANAENIVVKDMIDITKFDMDSLIPLSGSAPFETRVANTNRVEFIFENINLPFDDANNDGYVAFKIKTKPTLVVGSTFANSASIFFDYNAPIVTNTFTTTVQALATQDFDFNTYFSVYPVPAQQILNLQTKEMIEIKSIEIYNLLGQMVIAIPNAVSISTVDVAYLKAGTYFIKVNTSKGTANTKFVKE
ncbi:T9SS type A sorting domain-containing protein [Flavobacterium silvisoli]|uniref:T9SS type A sorting domain-containing protein n=1 Tax=Flavobacterium silvisoli TaxID=2529433 RepID=A0A4Q9Z1J1_9FLAO|nr:T9SS type A sorting domain-containing protein [Flavobacterium silvisoli]TBX70130.1 T9SS type A sorting domain-containing protein [Flavobacterium silvisoli]